MLLLISMRGFNNFTVIGSIRIPRNGFPIHSNVPILYAWISIWFIIRKSLQMGWDFEEETSDASEVGSMITRVEPALSGCTRIFRTRGPN
jgi:hypothetical protein